MSLPPALLSKLAQRGLVNKQKSQKENEPPPTSVENEEVIAEDYDELDAEPLTQHNSEDYQYPSQYDLDHDTVRKPVEDSNWLSQMKTRMGEAGSAAGYRCCPNKYNVWHKCTLFCVNRWSEGIPKPSPDYMKRYRRLIRKYPLPKGWVEMYDPGCGCYYFACEADSVVSWLPPTHPKSVITKGAATVRRQMEESTGETAAESDTEDQSDNDTDANPKETAQTRHHREVDEIINASMRSKSPRTLDSHDFPTLQEANDSPSVSLPRKQKTRDLDRAISRQRKERGSDRERDRNRDWGDRDRERDWPERGERIERDRDRDHNERNRVDRDRERDRDRDRYSGYRRPYKRNNDTDKLDPMDPSAYSDTPRGKWSDGLQTGDGGERKARNDGGDIRRDNKGGNRDIIKRSSDHSDKDDDDDEDDDGDDEHDYR